MVTVYLVGRFRFHVTRSELYTTGYNTRRGGDGGGERSDGVMEGLRNCRSPNPLYLYTETFWVFKGICWLESQKRPEKIFKI